MATLSVNIDHIATLREARKGKNPDPVAAAVLVELAGAHGITCHLREDRRHIQDRDLYLLKQIASTRLNLEMAATQEMVRIATEHLPHMVTLVPEKREELTTEGGLDVITYSHELSSIIATLQEHNILVSLFIDPDISQIKAAAKVRANYVELHTGVYANATGQAKEEALSNIQDMAIIADKLKLGVNAGHGLDYSNTAYIASIDLIQELNIGHSIIARSAFTGIDSAVKEMLEILKE